MTAFFRFPHTLHLVWLGAGQPRADKLLSPLERDAMLAQELVVEEKVDGANLGFSLSSDGDLGMQNRGQYLFPPYVGQFTRLSAWLAAHEELLFDALEEHLIVFGEWCTARHSLHYTALPDWWLLFDVYDKRADRFFSTARRDAWAEKADVAVIHRIAKGHFDLDGLKSLLDVPSHYRRGSLEGIVLRQEDRSWLRKRAKLVRPEFTQTIGEHWSRRSVEWNQRRAEVDSRGTV